MKLEVRASILIAAAIVAGCGPSDPGDTNRPTSDVGSTATEAGSTPATPETATPTTAESGLWGCTMCPEVQSRQAGSCPSCGMKLVLRHGTGAFVCLDHAEQGAMDLEPGACRTCGKPFEAALTRLVYACSTHEQVLAKSKGTCAVCGRETRAKRMALIWECDEHGLVSLDAGRCPKCDAELYESLVALPHGDHSPRHGGQFFMAPNRWHHIEGTLPEKGTFRLYVYDNFTRPMEADGISGFVQVGHLTDDGDVVLEEERHALEPVQGASYLEVARPQFQPPLDLALTLDLSGGKAEPNHFDFTFSALSVEPEDNATEEPPSIDIEVEIPDSTRGILAAIDERRETVRGSIETGRVALIYKPALEAKELALALEDRTSDVPKAREAELAAALYQAVRGAWLLDVYGDLGELEKVRDAYDVFATGLDRLKSVFSADQRARE